MGLMTTPASNGQLVLTPHPVTLEGQRHIAMDLQPGERLCDFLHRHVIDLDQGDWSVSIGGRVVPRHLWAYVYPKDGQVIEVRGAVGRNALYIVAMIALTYFTFGIAGAGGAAAAAFGGGTAGAIFASAVFVAGSLVINKVLGPKVESPAGQSTAGTVYSLGASRNRMRPYEPLGLLFGRTRFAPDIASKTYSWYEGNDQYIGMVLTPGIGVGRVEAYSNADTLLSSYEGVSVFHSGYSQMPEQTIPLYSNVDTIDGGELPDTADFVTRTTSADTVRIQINLEYVLGGVGTSGKAYNVSETVQVQYAPAGTGIWTTLATQIFTGDKLDVSKRATLAADVAKGQYDVRVRILGQGNYEGDNTQRNDFQWSTMGSVQADTATYAGLARTGILMKATGQLNGQPDELRAEHIAAPIPVWRNGSWVTEETSNPGAHILKYVRGYYDQNGRLIAGMGKSDEEIDIESLQGFMGHCEANGYNYDYWLTEERNHDEVLQAIALAGMGQTTWAGGRLSAVWAADEQPLSGVVNMAEMKKGSFSVDYTLASAADGIEYSYFDSTTKKVETLRVPAPGVETMLNPARLTGEGIGREAHAAEMARYHLGQSLFQYKDIGFAQDLQYLSYRRMSMLSISHDLTQWGFGGRIVAAERSPLLGTVTLTLDEPVPPPDARNAFIGLRIPGEAVYRTFRVRNFTEATDTIQLVEEWPDDAPLPGEGYADSMVQGGWQDNPAHDTVWIYDFKATPGLRVRVVAIEPESDLKGASISVVPEPPEFWTYVKTGEYIPPDSGSSLATRPILSNLAISEDQITTGDVTATDLVARFDITGPFDHAVVYASASDGNGELVEVAQTRTRTARWRIPRAGTYTINVRPFGPEGQMGVGASLIFTTIGADAPPVNYDLFDVEEISGGIRRYTWGFWNDTIQSANLAGAEIRYAQAPEQGAPMPAWDAMTPVGDSGYHTGAFDSPIPSSGKWTFAIRARNTNGTLSVAAKYVTKMLGKNLGELQEEMQQAIDKTTEEIRQGFLEAAERDRQIAEQALAAANKARDDAIAHADALNAALGDLVNADEWTSTASYPEGDFVRYDGRLYRARAANSGVMPADNPATWQNVGNYSSAGEAVAAALDIANQTANELEAESTRLAAVVARLPAGNGQLATSSSVSDEATARASADGALGQRTSIVEARMPAGNGGLATAASVTSEATARTNADSALGQRIGVVEARMPTSTGSLATSASVTSVETASADRDTALGQRIDSTNSAVAGKAETSALNALSSQVQQVGNQATATSTALTAVVAKTNINSNMLRNPTWARGSQSWILPPGAALFNRPDFGPYFGLAASNGGAAAEQSVNASAGIYTLSSDIWKDSGSGVGRIEVAAHGASGLIGSVTVSADSGSWAAWKRFQVSINAPSGTTRLVCRFIAENSPGSTYFRRAKLEPGLVATMWTDDTSVVDQASATQSLEARMTVNENGIASYYASYTWALDVSNKVIGMRSSNNGFIGKITFSADVVEIIGATPGGGRNEFVGGKFYAYAPNGRRVVALGYGVT
ncbi:host specificity factor TipJ family phage tail protein [Xanthomonas campestris]|uniref:host specificity factor TipJ family phage tail protein n=1 Tax=Xanthomonas campestris TaxID=339 RepID=UPI002B22DF87|nr:host specificity factor TipJ family phage tail protein [Xanthomonas campestris]MEA9550545.1 host specificity factor TipJ family phage tail protein [Xanthomonas campestris]